MTPFPTQADIVTSLRSFLTAVLPAGVDAIVAQENRVPEPTSGDYVIMTPLRFERIETNVDGWADVRFTGSIAGTTMSVTDVSFGEILVGATVFGVGVAPNTAITALGTGTGGPGTYAITPSQTIASETLSSGAKTVTQAVKVTVQIDCHSANDTDAGDFAQTISTLLRDEFGVDQFAGQSPNYGVVPLYADDPKQTPFLNDAQQYEWKWTLEAVLQANQQTSVPQQYADVVDVDVISVDAAYGP